MKIADGSMSSTRVSVAPTRLTRFRNAGTQAFCFNCALILVFLRFSCLHETVAAVTGVNTYVLYIFGPIAFAGVMADGGLQRILRQPAGTFSLAFVTWMILAVPFSSWRGGSLVHVLAYLRTDFLMLFVTAGLARSWGDCRKVIHTVALAGIFNLATAHFLVDNAYSDRLTLQGNGIISNPNDLAAHLLLILPFFLFVVIEKSAPAILRIAAVMAIPIGLFQILRTGSRGALVAIGLTTLFLIARGSARQRVTIGVAALAMSILIILLLPATTWSRLTTFSGDKESGGEAVESSEARGYLLKQSIVYTIENPFFGVGPGQFSTYEGKSRVSEGFKGYWHETHNSYTQISSECGIPALVFYLMITISNFRLLAKIQRKAAQIRHQEIAIAAFCLTIALVAYSVVILFVNFAYRFYMPAISGLLLAIWFAACREVSRRTVAPRLVEGSSVLRLRAAEEQFAGATRTSVVTAKIPIRSGSSPAMA
jgi:O-antigen ligase